MAVQAPPPNGQPVDANQASHKAAEWPLLVVDDLLRRAASESAQRPLLAYPKSEHGLVDYELFSALKLDHYVSQAAQIFIGFGLCFVVGGVPSKHHDMFSILNTGGFRSTGCGAAGPIHSRLRYQHVGA